MPQPSTMVDFDFIVVGSGFGGSVSALRLSERGHRVAVIEQGKRFAPEDFPKSNWNLRKYLWAPRLGCYGIQAISMLRDVLVLHGAGVGGGSLVYANTLLTPPERVFREQNWPKIGDWFSMLAPHYATARKMLGSTPFTGEFSDTKLLHQLSKDMGREHTFHKANVGIYFGEPGKSAPDPYFNGEGPSRVGCVSCGSCMTGCRHNAKNTLDKNYLYLAEKKGAQVIAETRVLNISERSDGTYEVETKSSTRFFSRRHKYTCKGVVFAGGVMGTLPLLFHCKKTGGLARLSDKLGHFVRTNSEALLGAKQYAGRQDLSEGIAITAGMYPDEHTHIELVRYGKGHDFMSLLSTILVGGGGIWPRPLRWLGQIIRHPIHFLRSLNPFGFAQRSLIVLAMQPIDNHLSLRWRRPWFWPFEHGLISEWSTSQQVPKYFPIANEVAEKLAEKLEGRAGSILPEVLFNLTTTAHIMGGCPMSEDPKDGVVDPYGKIHGYKNLYVVDGSVIPVNLSVNPALTITALAEWVMNHIDFSH